MRRHSPNPDKTPLNQKQQELAKKESQLRGEMEKLERMIADAPRIVEETTRRQREELLERATVGRRRLDVSITVPDKWLAQEDRVAGKRGSLRKERREGRIIFLVLVIALTVAVVWLVSHFRF